MSQRNQIIASILAAGYVQGHSTGLVTYYNKGSERVQVSHEGAWKRFPDRVMVVTNFALSGVAARPDKWTQFYAADAAPLAAFLAHIAPAIIAVVPAQPEEPEAANPLLADLSDEELDVYAPLS